MSNLDTLILEKKYEVFSPESRHVVIYHASCADGFCAAVVMWETLVKNTEVSLVVTIPMHYNEPVPSDLGPNDVVYLVDFSFKRQEMYELCRRVKHVFVLDHHKTAKEELTALSLTDTDNFTIIFDMKRSGAKLAWDFCKAMEYDRLSAVMQSSQLPCALDTPKLVQYVQDRDLWTWELPDSKEISAYLQSFEFDLGDWAAMLITLDMPRVFRSAIAEGEAILRYQKMQVDSAVSHAVLVYFPTGPTDATINVQTYIVNATINHSEIGHELCALNETLFAVTWFQRQDGKFIYSLRSGGKYDVSEIAKAYGGGGHPAAAGFESDKLISCY